MDGEIIVDRWMDGWVDKLMNGWMNERRNESMRTKRSLCSVLVCWWRMMLGS